MLEGESGAMAIINKLNSHFWFEKMSTDGDLNRIRGHVIYPLLAGCGADGVEINSFQLGPKEHLSYDILPV